MATASGLYTGTVRRVDTTPTRVWVDVPLIASSHTFGPLESLVVPGVGDRVVVSYVNGGTAHHDTLIVLGVIAA